VPSCIFLCLVLAMLRSPSRGIDLLSLSNFDKERGIAQEAEVTAVDRIELRV
jgi:hypothetical protein